eukprot:c10150_g1_i1.p1 GENE.c10150_g1_i1~~c10150_g1_i1.p1  ORF type:complete len:245 (+),score=39.84 c10150_g1_i1:41-775(+)
MSTPYGVAIWADDLPTYDAPHDEPVSYPAETSRTGHSRNSATASVRGLVLVELPPCVLGIRVCRAPPVTIRRIESNSPLKGKVKAGYLLLNVNGIDLTQKDGNDVIAILASQKGVSSWRLVFQCTADRPRLLSKSNDDVGPKKVVADCREDDIEALQKHIGKYRVDVTEPITADNETALHIAAAHGSIHCAKYIVELANGALDLQAKDTFGNTALDLARQYQHTAIISFLVSLETSDSLQSSTI